MFEPKPISRESIPEALSKAERYRLLNEPWQAESICLDVLGIEPAHQPALVMLLLARTDQLGSGSTAAAAREVIPRLRDPYEQAYYSGIICERSAHAQFRLGSPGSGYKAYELFREAMDWYEKAETRRPRENDDAILRWNTCARILMRNAELRPRPEERADVVLDD